MTGWTLSLLLLLAAVAVTRAVAKSPSTFRILPQAFRPCHHDRIVHSSLLESIKTRALEVRGGAEEKDEDDDDDEEEEIEDSEDDAELQKAVEEAAPLNKKRVNIIVITNWINENNNPLMDLRVEVQATRTKDIASLKKIIKTFLPGKIPSIGLELMYDGRILDDDAMLLDEVLEEDEDEENGKSDDKSDVDDEDLESFTMYLNIVPPVDPKFGMGLGKKIDAPDDSNERIPTKDLIDAYFLNQVAMARNAELIINPNAKRESAVSLRIQAREEADRLKAAYKESMKEKELWEKHVDNEKETLAAKKGIQKRGKRIRKGSKGESATFRQQLQHNLNINWPSTIQHIFTLLFLGYYGGPKSSILLWIAPMVIIFQLRDVKFMWKLLYYRYFTNPPAIFKSLLPAPYQAILGFDYNDTYAELYQTKEEREEAAKLKKKKKVSFSTSEEVEVDDVEEAEEEEVGDDIEDEEEEFYDAEEYSYDAEVSDDEE